MGEPCVPRLLHRIGVQTRSAERSRPAFTAALPAPTGPAASPRSAASYAGQARGLGGPEALREPPQPTLTAPPGAQGPSPGPSPRAPSGRARTCPAARAAAAALSGRRRCRLRAVLPVGARAARPTAATVPSTVRGRGPRPGGYLLRAEEGGRVGSRRSGSLGGSVPARGLSLPGRGSGGASRESPRVGWGGGGRWGNAASGTPENTAGASLCV